jgi:hypothetical protein
MAGDRAEIIEQIQRAVAALVATQPAGVGLWLVGGFRYRLLDRAVRRSVDIDYHWEGDLVAKQQELVELFQRRLLPDIRRHLELEGSVQAASGSADDAVSVASIELAFWRIGSQLGRIEIPVDVTRIECADRPTARTADGIVYRTASNADMVESKVIAIVGRTFLEHRDLIDLHLFASHVGPNTPARLQQKLKRLKLKRATVMRRLADLEHARAHHARSLDSLIREQVDAPAAATLALAGGGMAILEHLQGLLATLLAEQGAEE